MMESAGQAPATNFGTLGKTFAKILRLRRASQGHGAGSVGVAPDDNVAIDMLKLKKSGNLQYSTILSELPENDDIDDQKRQRNREAMESLLADLFAGISAVKAAYAELQIAQMPYDPETIQSADQSVVTELKRLSGLKQSYIKGQFPAVCPDPQTALSAQILEQCNLIKTYQITTRKLEADLQRPDAELASLQAQLMKSEKQNRALEVRLHPGRTLAAVDELHLSGLSPTHFLTVLRYTFKSVRSFVKLMVKEMESAALDVAAAAESIHPGLLQRRRPGHRTFALESYVCKMMFSDFQHRDFSLGSLEEMVGWDCRRFYDEFTGAKAVMPRQFLGLSGVEHSLLGLFLRMKYRLLVHPKLETAIFGDLKQRALVSSGEGFPSSEFFAAFAEMGWCVWLLHCLFFSFSPGEESSIFEVQRGSRFSEVYMESVVEGEEGEVVGASPTVGFTVVPGFRVGRMVIQSKVYPAASSTGRVTGRRRS